MYLAVDDPAYPRNRLIRERLERDGVNVDVVAAHRGGSFFRRAWQLLHASISLLRNTGARPDVVVLSEFAAQYTCVAWLVARVTRAQLAHDYFVGLVETNVDDWGEFAGNSLRGRVHRFLDRVAVALPDLVICDTDERAQNVRGRTRTSIITLPVEAPQWARYLGEVGATSRPRVLFYGNYIPLHGVPTIIEALKDVDVETTIIGCGEQRPALEELSIGSRIEFEDAVPESELVNRIRNSHIVLGVFGTSAKAGSVIPNKVWQALGCGRIVVTRTSAAYESLPNSITAGQLIQVAPGDALALRTAISGLVESDSYTHTFPSSAKQIADMYEARWEVLVDWMRRSSRRQSSVPSTSAI